ncbi:MAG: FAD-binding oxidoreductase [Bacteroidota bacterium]
MGNAETCRRLSTATFPAPGKVMGRISAHHTQEVLDLLQWAGRRKVPLYPISGGKNWGYGSCVPPGEEAFVLSLAPMQKIAAYDEEAGVMTLEPGVSFRQVQQFLAEQGSAWQLNGPGSTPDASVVGNLLSRGMVQGPNLEHWKRVIAMEVALPNGELIRTDDHASLSTYRSVGMGPDVLPLFFQSNLGVVTKVQIQLSRRPNCWQHLHLCWEEAALTVEEVGKVVRNLRLQEIFRANVSIHNAEKIHTFVGQYPWHLTMGKTPLPKKVSREMSMEIGGGDWYLETAISGANGAILSAKKAAIEQAFADFSLQLVWGRENAEGPIFHRFTRTETRQMYWRKRTAAPAEAKPEMDGCGIIWFAPVIPWRTPEIQKCRNLLEQIASKYAFEPMLTFQIPNANYAYAVISLLYDRAEPGEDTRAMQAYAELQKAFAKLGCTTYRKALHHHFIPHSASNLLQHIKQYTDPANILSPGYYLPSTS